MDYSKIITSSDVNAFKNVNTYTGTVVFPTSLAADSTAIVDVVVPMLDAPKLTNFSAYFLEVSDANYGVTFIPQWYDANTAQKAVAIENLTFGGYDGCSVYPIINDTVVTVRGLFTNPYGLDITMAPLSVPFSFVEYTLDS